MAGSCGDSGFNFPRDCQAHLLFFVQRFKSTSQGLPLQLLPVILTISVEALSPPLRTGRHIGASLAQGHFRWCRRQDWKPGLPAPGRCPCP